MNKFIFTFGYDDGGGWAEIIAEDQKQAIELFSMYHPKRNGLIACCSIYSEEDFADTNMYKSANFGKRCVERISILHEFIDTEEGNV